MEEEVIKVEKKRRILPKIILTVFVIIFVFLLAIAGLFFYSGLDKKDSLSVFPHNYTVYFHADSAWDTVEPMLDLKAMDIFLSSPEFTGVRGMFMQLRASQWRKNKFLASLASKSVDGALYKNNEEKYNFIVSINLGALSIAGRAFPYIYDKLNVKGLYKENDHFIFDSNGTYYYIKPYKNLIVASDSPELLETAFEQDYMDYSSEQLSLFSEKTDAPVKIIANVSVLLESVSNQSELFSQINQSIPEDSLSLIYLKLTDENIKIEAKIPYEIPKTEDYLLASVLNKKSSTPAILSRFKENVQYYTILNAGTLEELKSAFLPLVVQDSDKLWKKADGLSKSLLYLSLDDLLFSWSGNEIVMFGLEGRNDPVFAVQVKDEKQRQKVFDKFSSSMLIKNNASLILDGVRIPRLELPSFLQDLLKLFDVSLPHPYYFIQDGYIYFSESAENLCEIYKSENKLDKISQDSNWKLISKGMSTEAAVSLYYNLERSIPFFLKSKASLSNILSLYQIGRADLAFADNNIKINLSAIYKEVDNGNAVPGFPISLEGKVDGNLLSETKNLKSKTNTLFWIENKKNLMAMEVPSTAITKMEFQDEVFIDVAPEPLGGGKGILWSATSHGQVYLLDKKLQVQNNFPIILNENISVPPFAGNDGLYIITEKGHMYWVSENGNVTERYISINGAVKSKPTMCSDSKGNRYIGIYDKSFMGKVVVITEGAKNESYYYDVPGIAFGSPAFLFDGKAELPFVSFITQSGDLYIWNMNDNQEIRVHLNGVFKISPVVNGDYIFAVATDGTVYRVDTNGDFIIVKIPNATCNEAFVSVIENNLYICPDGNILYGFDKNLELVYPFPVTGWGNPVFADVNGDNTADCFTLSIDNKLNAIKMR